MIIDEDFKGDYKELRKRERIKVWLIRLCLGENEMGLGMENIRKE